MISCKKNKYLVCFCVFFVHLVVIFYLQSSQSRQKAQNYYQMKYNILNMNLLHLSSSVIHVNH